VRDSELGKQRVDKLIKVRRLDGEEEWVLLHVEIQAQIDEGLPRRVYQYFHRIVDRYGRRVVTLVVLADPRPGWHPGSYEEELWGCRLRTIGATGGLATRSAGSDSGTVEFAVW
jgi:hypothetical protein